MHDKCMFCRYLIEQSERPVYMCINTSNNKGQVGLSDTCKHFKKVK